MMRLSKAKVFNFVIIGMFIVSSIFPIHTADSDTFYLTYDENGPNYQVSSISGGLGVTVTIDNLGTNDGENIDWIITLDGFVLVGDKIQGTISAIPAGGRTTISSGFVFGFGSVTITIMVDGVPTRAKATILGPLVVGTYLLQPSEPPILSIEPIAPVKTNVLAITINTGEVTLGTQQPYDAQPGDEIVQTDQHRWIVRNGETIGALVGEAGDIMFTFDELNGLYVGDYLPVNPEEVEIETSQNGQNYSFHPMKISRKTRPTNLARIDAWEFDAPLCHTLYLHLPNNLQEGNMYSIHFADENLGSINYTHLPRDLHSEVVHVSQLGFRPDDPVKIAFLSSWMGDGGAVDYVEGMTFEVIDDETDESVFTGFTELALSKEEAEDEYGINYAGTDVYYMDFSSLQQPGQYRVYVQDIGCSLSFLIGDDVWQEAFRTSVRGMYHQRSGIELGPPYTDFERPRSFHPDDGVVVYASTTPLMDTGNGLKEGADNFEDLVAGKTDEIVPDAWGGTMDAGDWDRRIQHLDASRLLLELAQFFPTFASDLDLNIPESKNILPDIVDEALWNVDFYKRLQTPEGGIRGGIESEEHPRQGELSWQESLTVMAYAPGPWSSFVYAGVAARASLVVQSYDPERADEYLQSALRAMEWAENELPNRSDLNDPHQVNDSRNLAAAELYRVTGDERWHQLFLNTTAFTDPDADVYVWQSHDQADAAWVYVVTQNRSVDEQIIENCYNALIRDADQREQMAGSTSYRFTKRPWHPVIGGVFSSPLESVPLVHAHVLTGEERYLVAAILSAQMGAGANPLNLCYTTGVGSNYPDNVLHIDSRIRGLPSPLGFTVLGPIDHTIFYEALEVLNPYIYPKMNQWPIAEFFFDVFWVPMMSEFTIQTPMASNMYVWGYLAARS